MKPPEGKFASSNPIAVWAALVGGISFLLGYIGPVLFSDSNLGPLLGIFITGPLGLLLGALIGILVSASRKAPEPATTEVRWLGAAWLGALLFTLASTIVGVGWLSIATQLSVILCAIVLFYFMPVRLPEAIRRSRLAILIGAALVVATSIFPPIESPESGNPNFAFFLDQRFDASTRVPEYTVDGSTLLTRWLIIVVVVGLFVLVRTRGEKSQSR